MRSKSRAKLQIHLLKRGVYVAIYNNRYTLSEVLFDVLQEEKPHKWIDEELIAALAKVKPIITITLQERLNPKLNVLAVVSQTPKSAQPIAMTPQPPAASIPQQAAPTATQQQAVPTASTPLPATAPTPPGAPMPPGPPPTQPTATATATATTPPAAPPIPPATPTAAPPATPTAAPPATPIAAPPATPTAAPATPATPPGPQSSNYDQLLRSREQQPQQPQRLQQLHRHTLPEPAVPGVEQGPRQGPGYSKEVATIAKIYTDFCTNRILTNKLVTAYQRVSVKAHNPISVG